MVSEHRAERQAGAHLPVDVHHVPRVLKLSDVVVAEQRILFVRVEQREVLHDDGCNTAQRVTPVLLHTLLLTRESPQSSCTPSSSQEGHPSPPAHLPPHKRVTHVLLHTLLTRESPKSCTPSSQESHPSPPAHPPPHNQTERTPEDHAGHLETDLRGRLD